MRTFSLALMTVVLTSCQSKYHQPPLSSADSAHFTDEILIHRVEVDSFFRYDEASPFRNDTSTRYEGVKWFPPNVKFYLKSKLYQYSDPETVIVLGTKGEERKHLKYGYFDLNIDGKEFKMNVYKFTPSDARRYALYKDLLNVWFTDRTTGKETYEVGRYVEIGAESPDPDFLYTINFNNAYNPYCAYSSKYSCAIPRKEDYLDVAIRAGEMKYSEHH